MRSSSKKQHASIVEMLMKWIADLRSAFVSYLPPFVGPSWDRLGTFQMPSWGFRQALLGPSWGPIKAESLSGI